MLGYAEKAKKRQVPVANPRARKVDAKTALEMAMKRYPKIIANLAD